MTGLLLSGATASTRADLTWDWSYTQTMSPVFSGSGTFTTSDTTIVSPYSGDTGYLLTGMAGNFGGGYFSVTALGAPGDIIYSGGLPVDNLLVPTGGGSAKVDADGVGMHFDSSIYGPIAYEYEFYDTGAGIALAYAFGNSDVGTLTITEVSAPEPSSLIGSAAVLAILAVVRARKFLPRRNSA